MGIYHCKMPKCLNTKMPKQIQILKYLNTKIANDKQIPKIQIPNQSGLRIQEMIADTDGYFICINPYHSVCINFCGAKNV